MRSNKKETVISCKVDQSLADTLKNMPNKSDFIRAAILAALDNVCPLCRGTGILTPEQRKHWESFATHHILEQCNNCQAIHIVCTAHTDNPPPEQLHTENE